MITEDHALNGWRASHVPARVQMKSKELHVVIYERVTQAGRKTFCLVKLWRDEFPRIVKYSGKAMENVPYRMIVNAIFEPKFVERIEYER